MPNHTTQAVPDASADPLLQMDVMGLLSSKLGMRALCKAMLTVKDLEPENYDIEEQLIEQVLQEAQSGHDPNYILAPEKDVAHYLNFLPPFHLMQIHAYAKQLEPMQASCRLTIAIPVASRQEGTTIYQTLKSFSNQSADPALYEIVLFENSIKGSDLAYAYTAEEIRRFQANYPYIRVQHFYDELAREQMTIGYLRKLVTDLTLLRYQQRGDFQHDHYISRTDADTCGIHQRYVETFLRKFEQNPFCDAFYGPLDFALEHYAYSPLLYFGHRFQVLLEQVARKKAGYDGGSVGPNVVFRASAYAHAGGYSAMSKCGEDISLDNILRRLRAGAVQHRTLQCAGSCTRLFSSARRGAKALELGFAPLEQWGVEATKFGLENAAIRNHEILPNRKHFIEVLENPELLSRMQSITNATLKFYRQAGTDQFVCAENTDFSLNKLVLRILGHLGIKADVNRRGKVYLRDVRKFQKNMLVFIEEWEGVRERITNGA